MTPPWLAAGALLFVPADSPRKIAKALDAPADALILDLEDAVAPTAKIAARSGLGEAFARRERPVGVRINGRDTEWRLDDLAAVSALAPAFIMLPKCEGPEDLAIAAHQLDALEAVHGLPIGAIALLPLVTETAVSLGRLDYRGVTPRLAGLGFAGEDLSSDLGVRARTVDGSFNPLLAEARRAVAVAAAAAGVAAIDTPFPDPADAAGLAREAADAAALGYWGKMCIHPAQVEAVRDSLRPDPEQLAWARAVIAALGEDGAQGVALLDGKMIDKAHLRLARRLVTLSTVSKGA